MVDPPLHLTHLLFLNSTSTFLESFVSLCLSLCCFLLFGRFRFVAPSKSKSTVISCEVINQMTQSEGEKEEPANKHTCCRAHTERRLRSIASPPPPPAAMFPASLHSPSRAAAEPTAAAHSPAPSLGGSTHAVSPHKERRGMATPASNKKTPPIMHTPLTETRRRQKEKSDTSRSVLQGMNWRFLTETILSDRDYPAPPPVLTKEGYEYVQKMERERAIQRAMEQGEGGGDGDGTGIETRFQTPTKAPLQSILSDLVSPGPVHSAYFSPPVAPAAVRDKLGLFDSSPSNTRAHTNVKSPSKGSVRPFYADTPIRRAQAQAHANAKRALLQSIHPVDETLLHSNSRKSLPPLPPKPTPADLNISNEFQQRQDGLMESLRDDHGHDMDAECDTLEAAIIRLTEESVKESQQQPLPKPHPILDRTPRKAKGRMKKKGNVGGAGRPGGRKMIRFVDNDGGASVDGDVVDGSASSNSDSSTDPELDDDASFKLSRVERARIYHAKLQSSLTDPFADEKRLKRSTSGTGISVGAGGGGARAESVSSDMGATPAQIIVWKESARVREAIDLPTAIEHALLAEPTTEDRLRFLARLNQAQEEDAARQEAEAKEQQELDRHTHQLRAAINGGLEPFDLSAAAPSSSGGDVIAECDESRDGCDSPSSVHGVATVDNSHIFAPLSPSQQGLQGEMADPLSLTPAVMKVLNEPTFERVIDDEDAHGNPFKQARTKSSSSLHVIDDSLDGDVERRARETAIREFRKSLDDDERRRQEYGSPKTSTISLAPNTPLLTALDQPARLALDPAHYADPTDRFAREHLPLQKQVADIVGKEAKFVYQSTQASKLAALQAEREARDAEERSEAILSGTLPPAVRTAHLGRLFKRKGDAHKVGGVPTFAFSPELQSDSLLVSHARAVLDFAALNRESSLEAASKSRRKAELMARRKAMSPSPTNPQPTFKSPKSQSLPYSITLGSSFIEPVSPIKSKKQLGAWYLRRKDWKVKDIPRNNDDVQDAEYEEERLDEAIRIEESEFGKEFVEKTLALQHTLPTLFIASVYKGHLEKCARQQQQCEREEKEKSASFTTHIGGKVRGTPMRPSLRSTASSPSIDMPLSPENISFGSFTSPIDPLANVPVRIPSYLQDLIPIDPTNPDVVIVDFPPGTNKLLTTPTSPSSLGGTGKGKGPFSPTKASVGVTQNTNGTNVHVDITHDDTHNNNSNHQQPSSNSNLNVPHRTHVTSPSSSFDTPVKRPIVLSPTHASPAVRKSPNGKSPTTQPRHRGHQANHSVSDMIIAHQSATIASMLLQTPEEAEEAALLAVSASMNARLDRSRQSSFTSPASAGKNRSKGGALGLPHDSLVLIRSDSKDSKRRSLTLSSSSGSTMKSHHGHGMVTIEKSREVIPGLVTSHHAHNFLPNIQPNSGPGGASSASTTASNGGINKNASAAATVNMRAYIMAQSHSHADLVDSRHHPHPHESSGVGGIGVGSWHESREFEPDDEECHHPLEVGIKRETSLIRTNSSFIPASRVLSMERDSTSSMSSLVGVSSSGADVDPAVSTSDVGVDGGSIMNDLQVIHNPSTMVHTDVDSIDTPIVTVWNAISPTGATTMAGATTGKKRFFAADALPQPKQY